MDAMKINIALTININSSSSPDKREGNDDLAQNFFRILPIKLTFHLRIRSLASYFAVQRRPERKEEKRFTWKWRNSKENVKLKNEN